MLRSNLSLMSWVCMLMPLLVSAMASWVVLVHCAYVVPLVAFLPLRAVLWLLAGTELALLVTALWRTSMTDPGRVPHDFLHAYVHYYGERRREPAPALLGEEGDGSTEALAQEDPSGLPMVAYCTKCERHKPDRAHHCRTCGHCILKMDHHCPWVNNCVGFHNYRFFILFLTYTWITAMWMLVSSTLIMWASHDGWNLDGGRIQKVIMVVFAAVWALTLVVFALQHYKFMLRNQTTLEDMSTRNGTNPWDLGAKANFRAVMGNDAFHWWLPFRSTPGNGIVFDLNPTLPRYDSV